MDETTKNQMDRKKRFIQRTQKCTKSIRQSKNRSYIMTILDSACITFKNCIEFAKLI